MADKLSGCKCCCNKVVLEGFDSPLAAYENITVVHPRASCNWLVDLPILDSNDSIGTTITIGRFCIDIISVPSHIIGPTPTVRINGDTCNSFTSYTRFLIRAGESVYDGTRHFNLQIYTITGSLTETLISNVCFCEEYVVEEGEECTPSSVTISITAGDEEIEIGEVEVSDTSDDQNGCPAVRCSPCNVLPCLDGTEVEKFISGVTVTIADLTLYETTQTITGGTILCDTYYSRAGAFCDYSVLNGTYVATPKYLGDTVTQEEIDDLLLAATTPGSCSRCESIQKLRLIEWTFPEYLYVTFNYFREYHTADCISPGYEQSGPYTVYYSVVVPISFRIGISFGVSLITRPPGVSSYSGGNTTSGITELRVEAFFYPGPCVTDQDIMDEDSIESVYEETPVPSLIGGLSVLEATGLTATLRLVVETE